MLKRAVYFLGLVACFLWGLI